MPDRHADAHARLIDEAAALVAARLGPEEAPLGERFTRIFFRRVPPVDIAQHPVEELAGIVLACWRRFVHRTPGRAHVSVLNPTRAADGFVSVHTLAVTINDDMPFLVDSTSDELSRRGWSVHMLVHPVMRVRRGAVVDAETGAPVATEALYRALCDELAAALARLGITATPLEAVAPGYLSADQGVARLDPLRSRARRF
jgi:NAD-specific glutamate dehydrogenase